MSSDDNSSNEKRPADEAAIHAEVDQSSPTRELPSFHPALFGVTTNASEENPQANGGTKPDDESELGALEADVRGDHEGTEYSTSISATVDAGIYDGLEDVPIEKSEDSDETISPNARMGEASSMLVHDSKTSEQGQIEEEKASSTDGREDIEDDVAPETAQESGSYDSIFNRPSQSANHASHIDSLRLPEMDTRDIKSPLEEQHISQKHSSSVPEKKPKSPPSTVAEEIRLTMFMHKRIEYWKEKLATKHESEHNLKEPPSDMLDFNASMLSREDYDQMVAERTASNPTHTEDVEDLLSRQEQAAAVTALLYGLAALKAATPAQQHDMVSRLMHDRVCRLQPALVFEMVALLLEIDTPKLLTLSVEYDALQDKARKIARAWGVEMNSLGVASTSVRLSWEW